ncbi:hypothetical protein niasHT_004248 [Heterodera trifolii]|uniref:Uncharacterized protein n=1 Tax=Heterodera trifolii TaxID=157864 RepID=A0ABD2MCL3_9BILA
MAICVEEAYDENLPPGEISFDEGQFNIFTQMAISMAADQARTLFSQLYAALPNILNTRRFVVSNIPDNLTIGLMDVAFSGYVFATGEVLGVSRIIEKIVGMSDFGLRKVIVPTGNTAQIYAHEREHPEDFGNVTIMPCGSCLEIINAGIF